MIVYLLDFKQYGDRLAKKFDTIDEYDSYILQSYDKIEFNKNDGIIAKQILNTDTQANYFIVCDDEDNILSRWYVTEAKWIRNNQSQYVLYRDLLADYQDIVKNSTCKINRAMLEYNDPLIFNSEGITVNQIKKSETLLKDNTGVPWLVAYVDPTKDLTYKNSNVVDLGQGDSTIHISSSGAVHGGGGGSFGDTEYLGANSLPLNDLIQFDGYNQPTGYSITQNASVVPTNKYLNIYTNKASYPVDTTKTVYKYTFRVNSESTVPNNPQLLNQYWTFSNTINVCECNQSTTPKPNDYKPIAPFDQVSTSNPEAPANLGIYDILDLNGLCNNILYENDYIDLNAQLKDVVEDVKNNPQRVYKYYHYVNGKPEPQYMRYEITKKNIENSYIINSVQGTAASSLWQNIYIELALDPNRRTEATHYSGTINNYPMLVSRAEAYQITAIKVEPDTMNKVSGRLHSANGLYDMFCTPYATQTITTQSDGNVSLNKDTTLKFYQQLARFNNDAVYDIQILPYCPIDQYRSELIAKNYQTALFDSSLIPMLNIDKDSTTFNISFSDPMTTNNRTRKQRIITDFYRLCDPGYNGVFEFNSEKNNGISYFNVDMTLKPFSPFIHVNPNFGGLYGQDFNDARGLICGSNFSITTISNRFAEYEMNNKNWQQMFNRQVQNLEFTQKQERIQTYANAVIGTAQGAITGASGGAMIGGGFGAAVGGIAGGVLSGIGGAVDEALMYDRQREQMNYMKDMHYYQIDNIRALPDSLTRVTTMNNIYKYFPFLEYYSCTDAEKTVVNNWINWYSMTVNAIGTVNSYIRQTETFISATPLRSLLADDSHVDNALQREMEAGFFI